jgi:coenzyme F420-0:L-glutamate ligase/coenzyme F420-1:gamma-L-glutamate ligase
VNSGTGFVSPKRLEVTALVGIPEIAADTDLASLLDAACRRNDVALRDHDVLVVAQKIISKREGRRVRLADVTASARALELAAATGKDARLVELILSESTRVLRVGREVIIVEDRRGLVLANAGIDQSNVGAHQADSEALLLPIDPDASAAGLRAALRARSGAEVAVILSDSLGRAWRLGTVGHAIGVAGLRALIDWRGRPDREGRTLRHTETALADSLAAAAVLVMGEADEGRPAALVRGVRAADVESELERGAKRLQRPRDQDLFR